MLISYLYKILDSIKMFRKKNEYGQIPANLNPILPARAVEMKAYFRHGIPGIVYSPLRSEWTKLSRAAASQCKVKHISQLLWLCCCPLPAHNAVFKVQTQSHTAGQRCGPLTLTYIFPKNSSISDKDPDSPTHIWTVWSSTCILHIYFTYQTPEVLLSKQEKTNSLILSTCLLLGAIYKGITLEW